MAAIYLKSIPKSVHEYLLKIQFDVKKQKGINQYSLSKIIYKIIEEHEQFQKEKSKNK